MHTRLPKGFLSKLKHANSDSSPAEHIQPESETKGLSFAGITISPLAMSICLWLFIILCIYGAVIWSPSVASAALLTAAILACPVKAVRHRVSLQELMDALPLPERLSQSAFRASLAATFFFLGCLCAPAKGQLSVESYLDFQDATADVTGTVEYSRSPVNVFDYIDCDGEEVKLEALDDVNASRVGTQQVTVELSESIFSKQEELEIQVQDTQAPEIKLAASRVQVELGEDYSPHDNIVTVEDPVDGELALTEDEPTARGNAVGKEQFYNEGWYHVTGDVDTDAAGSTVVMVKALDQHGNQTTKSFTVEVIDPLDGVTLEAKTSVLEYSNKTVEAKDLVSCSDPDTTVTAEGKVDLQKVGKQTVTYQLSKGKSTRKEEIEFNVRDTKNPRISLESESVEIEKGAYYDPYTNVTSASDEVDGALDRLDAEPSDNGKGWYTIEGSYDVNSASKYFLTVVACDRNGNRTTKEFSLKVNEPAAVSTGFPTGYETGGPASPGTAYVINTNTGKFHYPSCRDVKRIAAHNRWDVTMTREEVTSMGYVPCKHCNP